MSAEESEPRGGSTEPLHVATAREAIDELDTLDESGAPGVRVDAFRRTVRETNHADVIAGRYELGEVLGRGGFGSVHRALDRLTGETVAIKLLTLWDDDEAKRFRAEVSLLRLLRLPNLVHLLDDGEHNGQRFLVMELVEGSRFPGTETPATWDELRTPTLRLLHTLARVHANGVVHRDLKPANVLVRPDGQPVVLDFGVAFGPGFSRSGERMSMGTPAYLAPEQALGKRGDARADLYALGVMLFDALTGTFPYDVKGVTALLKAKVTHAPRPVHELAPEVPLHVAATIDALLHLNPRERPASAGDVLERLGAEPECPTLPWLGSSLPLSDAIVALREGRNVATTGLSGSGHTRLLRECTRVWERTGGVAWTTRPSSQPWGSLPAEVRRELGSDVAPSRERLDSIWSVAAADGVALFVDDPERLDPSTAEELTRLPLPVMQVRGASSTVVSTPRWGPADLRRLFHGPDRVFHLREDAARIAHERSGGRAGYLVSLLDAWVHAGLCFWDDGRLRITREALDRLDAGMRVWVPPTDGGDKDELRELGRAQTREAADVLGDPARRAVGFADTIAHADLEEDDGDTVDTDTHEAHDGMGPPGSPERVLESIRQHDVDRLIVESMALRTRAQHRGNFGDAFAALREALAFVRLSAVAEDELALVRSLALTALESQSARLLDLAIYELERALAVGRDVRALARLLDATRLVRYVERDRGRALGMAERLPPFHDPEVDRWRRAALMLAGFALGPEAHLGQAREHYQWALRCGVPGMDAVVRGWVGVAMYRNGDFAGAAEMHELAARTADGPLAKAIALMNASSSWLDADEVGRARRVAAAAIAVAEPHRLTEIAASASAIERDAQQRGGEVPGRDEELEAIASLLDMPDSRAHLLMVEAGGAWRRGDRPLAARLAAASSSEFQVASNTPAAALAHALRCAAAGEPDAAAADAVEAPGLRRYPRLLAQVAALHMMCSGPAPALRDALREALDATRERPGPAGGWEILGWNDCAAALG